MAVVIGFSTGGPARMAALARRAWMGPRRSVQAAGGEPARTGPGGGVLPNGNEGFTHALQSAS